MIESIAEMPSGTFGFRASGELSPSDYRDVLVPPLREAIELGEKVRLLFQIGPGFEGFEAGAVWEDLKFGLGTGIEHLSAWERMAVVSDEDWVRRLMHTFGWLTPGEQRMYSLDQLDDAKQWLSR
jgi:SpoIIAA-like